ncbi:MAG: HEAT repeat domain-containing protein [Deltaproteobacteria bacterium]|nr:MAG: HEAT repeat domain-containing protein [Deltaproteobacteria bacterium]
MTAARCGPRPPRVGWLVLLLSLLLPSCGSDDQTVDVEETARALIEEGLSFSHPDVRAETVRLLSLLGRDEAQALVVEALGDEHVRVQLAAAERLLREGDTGAGRVVSQRMLQGSTDERRAMLRLLARFEAGERRQQVFERGLRDSDPLVRGEVLELAAVHGVALPTDDLLRLREDADPVLAERAFAQLVARSHEDAMEHVLQDLHSDRPERRLLGLRLSQLLDAPEFWPLYRALLRFGDDPERVEATLGLGMLGDPLVEDALRSLVVGGEARLRARALRAMSRLPGDRARQQALLMASDRDPAVRAAAFDVHRRHGASLAVLQPFLADEDAELARRALDHAFAFHPDAAAEHLAAALTTDTGRDNAMRSLLSMEPSETRDRIVRQLEGRLRSLVTGETLSSGDLALRVLGTVLTGPALWDAFGDSHQPWVRVYLAERAIEEGRGDGVRLEEWLDDELFFVRLSAALALLGLEEPRSVR